MVNQAWWKINFYHKRHAQSLTIFLSQPRRRGLSQDLERFWYHFSYGKNEYKNIGNLYPIYHPGVQQYVFQKLKKLNNDIWGLKIFSKNSSYNKILSSTAILPQIANFHKIFILVRLELTKILVRWIEISKYFDAMD